MQLKIRRSQHNSGVLSKAVVFCVDARVYFTPEEHENIVRYRLHNQVIYNSEASKQYLARSDSARAEGSFKGNLRSLALVAMAATRLNITIASLERGQRIECKSLDEVLGAQEALMTACENLKGYLDAAETFDGREVLFDFSTGAPEVAAQAPGLVLDPLPPLSVSSPAAFTDDSTAAGYDNAPTPESEATEMLFGLPPQGQLAVLVSVLVVVIVFLWAIGHAGGTYHR